MKRGLLLIKITGRSNDLAQLCDWSRESDNYGFTLTNPKFEFWLLLHFEDGHGVGSPKECDERLRKNLPTYDKTIDSRKFPEESVREAIARAERRDSPPVEDWHKGVSGTTVYKLVKKLITNP
jgi:hypothetical protein